jgi:hypothetical protein
LDPFQLADGTIRLIDSDSGGDIGLTRTHTTNPDNDQSTLTPGEVASELWSWHSIDLLGGAPFEGAGEQSLQSSNAFGIALDDLADGNTWMFCMMVQYKQPSPNWTAGILSAASTAASWSAHHISRANGGDAWLLRTVTGSGEVEDLYLFSEDYTPPSPLLVDDWIAFTEVDYPTPEAALSAMEDTDPGLYGVGWSAGPTILQAGDTCPGL